MGDFTAVDSVVHEEDLDISFIGDEHLLESVREDVSGLSILLVANEHLLCCLPLNLLLVEQSIPLIAL